MCDLFWTVQCKLLCLFHPHLSFVESLKTITDGKHFVAFCDSHSDSRTHSSIHTCCRSADIHHGHVKGALWVTEKGKHTELRISMVEKTKLEADTTICYNAPKLCRTLQHLRALGSTCDAWFGEDGIGETFKYSEDKQLYSKSE